MLVSAVQSGPCPPAFSRTLFPVVETAFERFSAEFLTERLRAGGALPRGRVSAVHPGTCQTTILSTIVPLRLEYSADAPPDAPRRLLLKASAAGSRSA